MLARRTEVLTDVSKSKCAIICSLDASHGESHICQVTLQCQLFKHLSGSKTMQALQNTNPLLLALGGAAAVGGVFLLSRCKICAALSFLARGPSGASLAQF